MHVFFRNQVCLHWCVANLDREFALHLQFMLLIHAMKALVLIDYNTGRSIYSKLTFSMTSIILPDSKHNVSNKLSHRERFYPKSTRPFSHTGVTNVCLYTVQSSRGLGYPLFVLPASFFLVLIELYIDSECKIKRSSDDHLDFVNKYHANPQST